MSGKSDADERARWAEGASELVGKLVGGKFRVEKILGRGGMGTIYVAVQHPLGRRVALKVLHSNLGDEDADPEFAKRFLLEAATLSQLAHPNIVVVHDYGSLEEQHAACFMAMELLEGRTIHQVLTDEGRFDTPRALRITRDIARALRAAHDLGVVHRDLKPSNVMLCPGTDGEGEVVKVLDFGLVKVLRDDSEELTAEGRFLGSPRYMSPEQIQRLPMDGRSDLYSLGVILYRMLSGEAPFTGDQAVQTLMAHLTKPPPPMSSHEGVRVPRGVEQIVEKLLEKRPADRYARAGDLVRAIDAVWPQLSELPLNTSGEHLRPLDGPTQIDLTPTTGSYPMSPLAPAAQILPATQPVSGHEAATVTALPQPAPSRRPAWVLPLVVLLGAGAGIGGAASIASLFDPAEPQPSTTDVAARPASPEPTVVEPAPDPVPVPPTPVDPPPAMPSTFRVTVLSIPQGATVVRDGIILGEAPLTVELDRAAVREHPVQFELRMHGRESVTFEQGFSEANVQIERELPRLTRRPSSPRPPPDPEGPRGPDLSIKMQR